MVLVVLTSVVRQEKKDEFFKKAKQPLPTVVAIIENPKESTKRPMKFNKFNNLTKPLGIKSTNKNCISMSLQ